MKKGNLKIRTAGTLVTLMVFMFLYAPLNAQVNTVSIISMVPPNPAPGGTVAVNFSYCVGANEESRLALAVSDTSTFRPNSTGGQTFLVTEQGINVATAVLNGGYDMNDQQGAAHCDTPTWNITLPSTLNEGTTYYIIVGGQIWWTDPGQIAAQNFISFTTPPPATGMSITKTAEITPVRPGDYVLYTIEYNYANANNVMITDQVPSNCTLIAQSLGGTNGGTTAGSALTWAFANTVTRVRGKAWFIVQVNAGAPYSTPISSIANWSLIDPGTLLPMTGSSNDAVIMTTGPKTFMKTQYPASPHMAVLNDTITYNLSFNAGGMAFHSLSTFDTDLSGFHINGASAIWSWNTDAVNGGGYIFSDAQGGTNYPHYLRDTPTNFCFGEVQGDIYIMDGTNDDGHIIFRDPGTPGAQAYGIGISPDGSSGNAGQRLWLQECTGASCTYTNVATGGVELNNWYTVKVLISDAGALGVRIQGKFWRRGDVEPAGWILDMNDATPPPCGYVGFQGNATNANYYDNLKISKSIQSYPVAYDTIPNVLTYLDGTPADTMHGPAVAAGQGVSWSLFTQLVDTFYSLTFTAVATNCDMLANGNQPGYNIFTLYTVDNPPVDSNSTTLTVPGCPETPTITQSWTYTPTSTPSRTPTPSYTSTPTSTPSGTPTITPTRTPTGTFTMTATPSSTRTPTPSRTVTMTPVYYPTLEMTKVSDINPAQLGATVVYTINYRNSGVIAANNVSLTDSISTNLTFLSATAGGVHTGPNPGGTVSWTIASIAPGGTGSVSFSAVVGSGIAKGTVIQNQAIAVCTPQQVAANSNTHTLNLDIPDLDLDEVATVPNPAVDNAEIIFHLTVAARIRMKFYTVSGELVRTMENDEVVASLLHGQTSIRGTRNKNDINGNNSVRWDCMNGSGKAVASGIYFYRVEAESSAGEKDSYLSKLAVLK